MAKSYRPVLRDQPMLVPVDLREWLPPDDHLVGFVLDAVEALDVDGLERVGGAAVRARLATTHACCSQC